jgi:hypothetical protein
VLAAMRHLLAPAFLSGKLEVVVRGDYHEGGWTTIYRCPPTKIQELPVVSCGV